MRVLVAGATGAIGRPLVPLLLEAGHEVIGTTRSEAKAAALRDAGASAEVLDATDLDAVRKTVVRARPDVVVNQLTALPDKLDLRRLESSLGATNRLRSETGPALVEAAVTAGAKRVISQSVAFIYRPEGGWVKDEDAPLLPPGGAGNPATAARTLEAATLETPGIEGLVLRYGYFYGPGTFYARGHSGADDVMRRRFPVVGKGTGTFSFIHVDDAAAATVAALEGGEPGVYNVVDDEPAPMREWLPVYAEALGAKRPLKVPLWLAKLAVGPRAATMGTELRGASNAKAKRELGWEPRYPSWRQGFAADLTMPADG